MQRINHSSFTLQNWQSNTPPERRNKKPHKLQYPFHVLQLHSEKTELKWLSDWQSWEGHDTHHHTDKMWVRTFLLEATLSHLCQKKPHQPKISTEATIDRSRTSTCCEVPKQQKAKWVSLWLDCHLSTEAAEVRGRSHIPDRTQMDKNITEHPWNGFTSWFMKLHKCTRIHGKNRGEERVGEPYKGTGMDRKIQFQAYQ